MEKFVPSTADYLDDPLYSLMTSMRWTVLGTQDRQPPPPYFDLLPDGTRNNLTLHVDRLRASAKGFHWHIVGKLLEERCGYIYILGKIRSHLDTLPSPSRSVARVYKLRICISKFGKVEIDSALISEDASTENKWVMPFARSLSITHFPPTVARAKVFVDHYPTFQSLYTIHKTTHRQHYNNSRSREGVSKAGPTQADVLLWNPDGNVMEASCSTPYFFHNNGWVTPSRKDGGNMGVTRRMAIETGLCGEAAISVHDLANGEMIWLSNAVRGFFLGEICLQKVNMTV